MDALAFNNRNTARATLLFPINYRSICIARNAVCLPTASERLLHSKRIRKNDRWNDSERHSLTGEYCVSMVIVSGWKWFSKRVHWMGGLESSFDKNERNFWGEKCPLDLIKSVGDILQSNGENRLKLPLSKYFFHFLSFMFTVWVFTSCLSYERHICMYWYIPRFLMHAHNQNWFFFLKKYFETKLTQFRKSYLFIVQSLDNERVNDRLTK